MYVYEVAESLGVQVQIIESILKALGAEGDVSELTLTNEQISQVEDVLNEMLVSNETAENAVQNILTKQAYNEHLAADTAANDTALSYLNADAVKRGIEYYTQVEIVAAQSLKYFLQNGVPQELLSDDQKKRIREARANVSQAFQERNQRHNAYLERIIQGKHVPEFLKQLPQKPVALVLPEGK